MKDREDGYDEVAGSEEDGQNDAAALTSDDICEKAVQSFFSTIELDGTSSVAPLVDRTSGRLPSSAGIVYQSGLVDAGVIIALEIEDPLSKRQGSTHQLLDELMQRRIEIVTLAENTFRSNVEAMRWLQSRHRQLGATPLEAMKSLDGCNEVEKQIDLLYS